MSDEGGPDFGQLVTEGAEAGGEAGKDWGEAIGAAGAEELLHTGEQEGGFVGGLIGEGLGTLAGGLGGAVTYAGEELSHIGHGLFDDATAEGGSADPLGAASQPGGLPDVAPDPADAGAVDIGVRDDGSDYSDQGSDQGGE
ncbi:MAG TPA: hypothetical protein VFU65_06365 [Actinocrinis sp.]|nr:hypothetical protein [Actinocrinis sp.]